MEVTIKLKYATITKVCTNLLTVKEYVAEVMSQGHEVISYSYVYKGKATDVIYKE